MEEKMIREKQEFERYLSHILTNTTCPACFFLGLVLPGEEIPWPGIVRIGTKVIGAFGLLVLILAIIQICRLFIVCNFNSNSFDPDLFDTLSYKNAVVKCLSCMSSGLSLIALPCLVELSAASADTPYPWEQAMNNLMRFDVLVPLVIIVWLLLRAMRNK